MDISYIQELKNRINEPRPYDQNKADEMMAALATQPGWEILKGRIETTIIRLLEPGSKPEYGLEMIGAVTMARELAIDALRGVISDVETSRTAKVGDSK